MTADGHTRRYSPAGDSREHSVLCRYCLHTMTVAYNGICDGCHERQQASVEAAS